MLCSKCTIRGYFTAGTPKKHLLTARKFEEDFGLQFIPDEIVKWREYQERSVLLPGKRKYDFDLLVTVDGPVINFLEIFEKQLIRFIPHKFYHRHQNRELKLLINPKNPYLPFLCAAGFFDYSQNGKILVGKIGSTKQYRELPDFSLLNGISNLACPSFTQVDMHFISYVPKHDTCLFPKSFSQWVEEIILRCPKLRLLYLVTDCSKKEFKGISVWERIWKILKKFHLKALISQFGPKHGIFKYDPAGKKFKDHYSRHAVSSLGADASKLEKVVDFMNIDFSKSKCRDKRKNTFIERKTFLSPGAFHSRSEYKSLAGGVTMKSFAFYMDPKFEGLFYRRYVCVSCKACRNMNFLKCKRSYCGKWIFE